MEKPTYRHPSEIAFADTDASGKLHFLNAFRHVEAAEHAFLRSRGVPVFDREAGGWSRVQVWCDYQQPLGPGDAIVVVLAMTRIGTSSITWNFEIANAAGETAAHGSMTTVRVDPAGHSQQIAPAEHAALTAPEPL